MVPSSGDLRRYIDEPACRHRFDVVEITKAFLARLEESQDSLNTAIRIMTNSALADARRIDAERRRGQRRPLDGMPIVLKDNIDDAGIVTTVGSAYYAARPAAPNSATAVDRLREAGAIVLAKAHMHELLYGFTSDNEFFGACLNPHDHERIPGGSSGGCAAALAADLCVGAIGSDTGGSIRIPAALCGVGGLRPTTGRMPNAGVHPLMPFCDTIGPMARSADDMASLFFALEGERGRSKGRHLPAGPIRLAVDRDLVDGADPEVAEAVHAAIGVLAGIVGAPPRDTRIPGIEAIVRVFRGLVDAAAYAVNREGFDEAPERFGRGVRLRLEAGKKASGHAVFEGLHAAWAWRERITPLFRDEFDILICPATRTTAPLLSEVNTAYTPPDLGALTFPWSLAGFPAVTVPCGLDAAKLPIGLQLIAGPGRDELILSAAIAFQASTAWHRIRPAVRE